jgi:hypothetical protein
MQWLLRGDGSTSTPPILTQLQGDSHGFLVGKIVIPVEKMIFLGGVENENGGVKFWIGRRFGKV